MRRKRMLSVLMCLILVLTGCEKQAVQKEKTGIDLYASSYPFYAIAAMITKDVPDLQLHCLMQPQDGCLRNYQLSDWDFSLLMNAADALIIGGRGLENYENLLYSIGEDGPAVISALYNMDLSNYKPKNMREESHWEGENPHIFLKIDGALAIADRIAASMMEIDPKYAQNYAVNLEECKNRLKSVLVEMHEDADWLAGKPVIVLNEALVYLAEEFSLKIVCCIDRESGEALYDQELENCLEELSGSGSKVILIEKQAPQTFCAALEAAGYRLARLDTLTTRRENEGPEGYFEAMEANAAAIKAAFAAEEENFE